MGTIFCEKNTIKIISLITKANKQNRLVLHKKYLPLFLPYPLFKKATANSLEVVLSAMFCSHMNTYMYTDICIHTHIHTHRCIFTHAYLIHFLTYIEQNQVRTLILKPDTVSDTNFVTLGKLLDNTVLSFLIHKMRISLSTHLMGFW